MSGKKGQIDTLTDLIRGVFDIHGIKITFIKARLHAMDLYTRGCRVQVEGKWKKTCVPDVFQCTNCKRPTKMDELCNSEVLRAYCPNCGAKMKRGAHE